MAKKRHYIFGGDESWHSADWTASDDRVRGGKSQSYLDCSTSTAKFHGELDIKTLGGAGFASQRTTGKDNSWDFSAYDGIEIGLEKADEKRYTFILKDEILPNNPENGREQSTISYEYDFQVKTKSDNDSSVIFIPWDKLIPTYRGKEKKDAPEVNLKVIRRISIMMRSFFGDQEGPFSLTIKSISAVYEPAEKDAVEFHSALSSNSADLSQLEKGRLLGGVPNEMPDQRRSSSKTWRTTIFIGGIVLFILASLRLHC